MDKSQLPQTAEEYITCFRQLAAITAGAIDFLENNQPIQPTSLDRIARNVETIACLRGDSGIYSTSRPQGLTDFQNEMYATEDNLRKRLLGLGYSYPAPRTV